jgi:hypothetical protein
VAVAPRLRMLDGGAFPEVPLTADPWEFQAACVEAFVASWRARGFSPVTIDNDIGLLERALRALGRPAWEVTPQAIDRVVGDLAVTGRTTATRREYVQIFKGFHRFLQARKATEIQAAFGVRLVCPVDEFSASRHVGDDSPAELPPPSPERVSAFFEFLKTRIATARKYAPAARDYALFRTLYHAGLRSRRPGCWTSRMCTLGGARSASCTCGSARARTRQGRGPAGCRCWMAWIWCCAGSWWMCAASSQSRRCCSLIYADPGTMPRRVRREVNAAGRGLADGFAGAMGRHSSVRGPTLLLSEQGAPGMEAGHDRTAPEAGQDGALFEGYRAWLAGRGLYPGHDRQHAGDGRWPRPPDGRLRY